VPVSVVIPTYNRKGMLQRALQSVFAQSVSPLEIIVVDDGSQDGTADWLARACPQVVCLSQANRGVSAARNCGIAQAQGEWIALLDADDVWLPTKLEQQWSAIEQSTAIRVCHTEELWVFNGKPIRMAAKFKKQSGWIFTRSLRHCAISPSTVLIQRTVFADIGDFDESLPVCEDYDLWLRITSKYPIHLVDWPLIEKHAGHGDQLSTSTWGFDRYRARALYKFLHSAALDCEQTVAVKKALASMAAIVVNGAIKHQNPSVEKEFFRMLAALSDMC